MSFDSNFSPFVAVGAFVVVVAGGAMRGQALTANTVRDNATADARACARTLHPAWSRPVVLCQGTDSDGDDYVTCTVGDGAGATEAIECRVSVVLDYQHGCRPMRAVLRSTEGR